MSFFGLFKKKTLKEIYNDSFFIDKKTNIDEKEIYNFDKRIISLLNLIFETNDINYLTNNQKKELYEYFKEANEITENIKNIEELSYKNKQFDLFLGSAL